MLADGTPFFLLIPDSFKERVLLPGKVIRHDGSTLITELEEPMPLEEGAEVVAFATVRNKFMQQGAVVVAQCNPPTVNTLIFKLVGDAVSAENRQTFRVSVAGANVKATIGQESDCLLCDVSPEGFAAITRSELKIGASIKVSFTFDGQSVSTLARVQTVRIRADGKYRYGFLIAEKVNPARKSLGVISASIQRQQLKRLAAA